MNKSCLLTTALLTLVLLLPALSSAAAQEETMAPARMTIERFVAAQNVENHEPVGVTDIFAAATEKAYAFLEASNISADVLVDFVWYHGDKEMARVPLSIRKGNRWRTYSSKKLAGRTGKWRVEIQDRSGAGLAALDFTVQ
ncbi:MAG: DUF2914 domain-containing protein [Desulfurivibrionaceae bacterium]|nr:DUF2914 domain-containing protein [Desulfobulbales bacterium]MDT8334474.1 DUF2914 domain-containing protein [Desulfurivibrionaceae bacterium]